MKKNLLLTALFGAMIGANAFAVPPASGEICDDDSRYNDNGNCERCPSNYNNFSNAKNSIEDCCIDELTYDSESGMCVAVAGNSESSTPDIASNASGATCDDTTIGATSGSTEMEALWNANTISIDWYNGDTKITTNTCTYDGAVTIPATPTKPGYTFTGWKIKTN